MFFCICTEQKLPQMSKMKGELVPINDIKGCSFGILHVITEWIRVF